MTPDKPARPLFFAALAFTLFMALNPTPPHIGLDRFGDKVQHMLAFGTMTVLARVGFRRIPSLRLLEHLSFLGALIEVFQAIPSLHRDCDWHDWVADTIATAVVLLILDLMLKRQPALQPAEALSHDGHR